MDRINVLQTLIDDRNARTYLEIGVSAGNTFLRIKARQKIAVDPKLKMSRTKRLRHLLTNPCNHANRYFEMTSDEFFRAQAAWLHENGLDIAFVDGLHTYEQALRDVESCLRYLSPRGVIVMHDCDPPSEAAAWPAESRADAQRQNLPGANDEWCGDTYKALVHLRSTRDDLEAFVIDCDYGLGVVTRGKPEAMLDFTREQIMDMPYATLVSDREHILNLKSPERFKEWVRSR